MQIIKLDATESTNTYLKELAKDLDISDFTVVTAKNQTKGRGQMYGEWQTEPGKNLTFSVLRRFEGFDMADHFLMNMIVSLAIYDTLLAFQIPRIKIKWPNDILSGSNKICGILIENVVSGGRLKCAIIGIGLNINQIDFPGNPKATSLKRQTGIAYNLEELLNALLKNLKASFDRIELDGPEAISKDYLSKLFRRGIASTFQNPEGSTFNGIIQGVEKDGKLQVLLEDDTIKEFGLKEIRLLY